MYLLSQISDINLNIGLYRDDGLAVSALTPRQNELTKKKLCQIFKANGFNITIEANKKSVNFLDVNFNLETETFKPYMKPNQTPVYVHTESNHPPSILKNIPASVNRRLSSISSNEEVFKAAIPPFQEALKKSGHDFELKFNPQINEEKRKKGRKGRNITYFNPPFSKNVRTNIGGKFLKLIEKCFPKTHPLNKIVNRNTIKISYRCMPNFKAAISKHNQMLLKEEQAKNTQAPPNPGCNCNPGPCPLATNNCQVDHVIYQATVKDEDQAINTYTGLTRNTFKKRHTAHKFSFNNRGKNSTTLSTHLWNLKDEKKNFEISWKIIDRAQEFNPVKRKCRLCIKEKYYIIFQPDGATLNTRSELFTTCRHRKRLTLEKWENSN